MRFPQFLLTLILALAAVVVSADTVTLVSGEKIEGKILSETATDITIEVAEGGVVEERVVKKTEVAGTSKAPQDEVAWQALKALKLGNDSLPSVQHYDAYINPLRAFTTQFPESKHKADAEKLLADFEAEKKRFAAGELKIAGKWMSKEEAQRERYQINATIAFNFMREQSQRDPITALNTFDLIDKQYPGSRAWIDAVEMAARLATAARQQADARLAVLQTEISARNDAMDKAAPAARKAMQADIEKKDKADQERLDAALKLKQKWPPFIPTSNYSLNQISNLAESEERRLKGTEVAKARESVKLAESARVAFDKKDLDAADELMRKARDAWSNNEMVKQLEKSLSEAKTAATVAAAEAAAEQEKKEEKAADNATAKPSARPSATDASTENTDAAPAEEEEATSAITPPRIIIGIIVLGLAIAGWKAYKSVKSKASEIIE